MANEQNIILIFQLKLTGKSILDISYMYWLYKEYNSYNNDHNISTYSFRSF